MSTDPIRPSRRDVIRWALAGSAALCLPSGRLRAASGAGKGVGTPGERILVIGAGISGLAAAKTLAAQGFAVTVLEARDRVGGRMWTDRSLGFAADMGAAWIQGVDDNPITELASAGGVTTMPTNWESVAVYDYDGRPYTEDETESLGENAEELLEGYGELAEEADEDMTFAQATVAILDGEVLDPAQQRQLAWVEAAQVEGEYAAPVEDLSLYSYSEDEGMEGGDVVFPNGYQQVAEYVATGLDVRLGVRVQRIEYDAAGVRAITDGETFTADRMIVTLPLGVLQAGSVTFNPPLPSAKQEAIAALRMGLLAKVILKFPSVFWPNVHVLSYVSMTQGQFPFFLNWAMYSGEPVLVAYYAANEARALDGQSDATIAAAAMVVLRTIFGAAVPDPVAVKASHWASDPFAMGSYSYIPYGSDADARDALAEPVGDRLFFAGEATNREYAATVHGAYLSGQREAERIYDP